MNIIININPIKLPRITFLPILHKIIQITYLFHEMLCFVGEDLTNYKYKLFIYNKFKKRLKMLKNSSILAKSNPEIDHNLQEHIQNKNNVEHTSSKLIPIESSEHSLKLFVSSPLLRINSALQQKSTIINEAPSPPSPILLIPSGQLSAFPSILNAVSQLQRVESGSHISQLKQRAALSNELITGISERYIQRIALLQAASKANKQKLALCAERIEELTNENQRYIREAKFSKEKLDLFQTQNSMMRFQLKEIQSGNKELHFSFKAVTQENQSLKAHLESVRNKLQSCEKENKDALNTLSQSNVILLAEKQRLAFQYEKLKETFNRQTQNHKQQKKFMTKHFEHQKNLLAKRIKKLQSQLKENITRASLLQNDQMELKKSIQLDKDNDERMKSQIELLNNRLNKLKESLNFTENSLSYAQQEMRAIMAENQEALKSLKNSQTQKQEFILVLKNRNYELETAVADLQQQISDLNQQLHNVEQANIDLESQKKDLTEKILELQHSISQLVSQVENHEHKAQVFQVHLNNLEEQKEQLQNLNKEIVHNSQVFKQQARMVEIELAEQTEKAKQLQQQASALKAKNRELSTEVFKLNLEKLTLSQEVGRLANEAEALDQKESMLQSQIGELKGQKQLKESLFLQKISALSKRQRTQQRQIQELSQELQLHKSKLQSLNQEIQEKHNEVINKDSQIHQLQEVMYELRGDNFRLEHQLQTAKQQCERLGRKVQQAEEQIQQLRQYVEQLQVHINQLDNILVWDFEEGKGQNSNSHTQRKEKMQHVVTLLHGKVAEIEALKAHKEEQASIIHIQKKINEEYRNIIEKFNQKISTFLSEKEGLTKMIEDIEINNRTLAEKVEDFKEKQVQWNKKERGLVRKIKSKDELIKIMNDEKNALLDKIQSLEKRVTDREQKIESLTHVYAQEREKNSSLKQMVERLTSERRRTQAQNARKTKELQSKYDSERAQNEERKNSLSQIEIDKKAQINALTIQIAQLKNVIKDFTVFFQGEKFNFSKRNLCLVDLGTALTKFEKTNNIKSHQTALLKDLLRKMEQFDNNSSKIFSKYSKFSERKEK